MSLRCRRRKQCCYSCTAQRGRHPKHSREDPISTSLLHPRGRSPSNMGVHRAGQERGLLSFHITTLYLNGMSLYMIRSIGLIEAITILQSAFSNSILYIVTKVFLVEWTKPYAQSLYRISWITSLLIWKSSWDKSLHRRPNMKRRTRRRRRSRKKVRLNSYRNPSCVLALHNVALGHQLS